VHYHLQGPCELALNNYGSFRIELALSARHPNTSGWYPGYWTQEQARRIGEMFIVAPGQELRIASPDARPVEAFVCHLDRELLFDLYMDHLGQPGAYPFKEGDASLYLPATLDLHNSRIRTLLIRMADEVREPGIAATVLIGSFAIQLVIELLRVGEVLGFPKQRGGLAAWQLRLIEQRLQDAGAPPSLPELAALCHISVRHLSRAFKESRGCTIGAFVLQRSVEHAKEFLAEGRSINAIAETLGFASSSGFCSTFRRETGFTPAEYRSRFLSGTVSDESDSV
jgi:AraC family transcriptional regulator